jgi:hypothetical protein
MLLNQFQKLKLASHYHQKAYSACMDESDWFKARAFYEKALVFNPKDETALFNLELIKVVT